MNAETVADILAQPVAQDLLFSDIPARLSYIGLDSDPRVVPVGFWWTGEAIVIATVVRSAKVAAIRRNPRVALTVDRSGMPPRTLLVRGSATVTIVDGVPDEYVEGARKIHPPRPCRRGRQACGRSTSRWRSSASRPTTWCCTTSRRRSRRPSPT